MSNALNIELRIRAILRNAKRVMDKITGTHPDPRKKTIANPGVSSQRRILELIAERHNLDLRKAENWHTIKTLYRAQLN